MKIEVRLVVSEDDEVELMEYLAREGGQLLMDTLVGWSVCYVGKFTRNVVEVCVRVEDEGCRSRS